MHFLLPQVWPPRSLTAGFPLNVKAVNQQERLTSSNHQIFQGWGKAVKLHGGVSWVSCLTDPWCSSQPKRHDSPNTLPTHDFIPGSLSLSVPQRGRTEGKKPRKNRGAQTNYQFTIWLVVSTPLKNISQNGNLPQIGVKIKNVWNHQLTI